MLSVKIGKDEQTIKDRETEAAIAAFVATKERIDALGAELKAHKERIVAKAREVLGDDEAQTVTLGVDDDRVKVSFGYDIKVKDEATLAELLGSRFDDLVKTVVAYKPEAKLKEMALEDDGLRTCLSVKEKAPAVAIVK